MMDSIQYLLGAHIILGSIALITGSVNLLREKGDSPHVFVGKVFTYSMLLSAISAIILAVVKSGIFLLMVGVFTLYMVGTGFLALQITRLPSWRHYMKISITLLAIAVGIFAYLGVTTLLQGNTFGVVPLCFSAGAVFFIRRDVLFLQKKDHAYGELISLHIQRIVGGYIASLTAFIVVNNAFLPSFIPAWVLWIAPTIAIVPCIVYWSRKYL